MKMKKIVRIITASLLIAAMAVTPVFATTVSIDDSAVKGEPIIGSETLVTNTDFGIENPEQFAEDAVTGSEGTVAQGKAAAFSLSRTTKADQCKTLELQRQSPKGVNTEALKKQQRKGSKQGRTAAPYVKGDTKNIWASGDSDDYQLEMECVAVGAHCTVWYPVEKINPKDAEITYSASEVATNFDGIYEKMLASFGDPSSIDVDRDGKIALMVDMSENSASTTLGYFWARDLFDPEDCKDREEYDYYYKYGNNMDMLNMNSLALTTESIDNFYNTLTHEFQHLINCAMTENSVESWLNETFAQAAPEVCGIKNEASDTYTGGLTAYIEYYKRTLPFVFRGDYVPRYVYEGDERSDGPPYTQAEAEAYNERYETDVSTVYASWYLFGMYIASQTKDVTGGGFNIYKTILEETGGCDRAVLTQILHEKGAISENTEAAFAEFVRDFNLALYLQEDSGRYSFNGYSVTDFKWPENDRPTVLPKTLRGGGACAVASHPDSNSYTLTKDPDKNMLFAGFHGLAKGLADFTPAGTYTGGKQVVFTPADGNETIRYNMTTDGSEPKRPTVTSREYTQPITLAKSAKIKVATFDTEGNCSKSTLLSYVIVPKQVTGVKAGRYNYNTIKLSWNSVSDASGYRIYRDSSAKGQYLALKDVSSKYKSTTDTALTTNSTYKYKVRAYVVVDGKRTYGNSSAAVSAKPTLEKPTVKLYKSGTSKVKVDWKGIKGATGYKVYMAKSKNGTYKTIATVSKSKTYYTKKNLTKGRKYYFKVRAYRTIKGSKKYSSYSTVKAIRR